MHTKRFLTKVFHNFRCICTVFSYVRLTNIFTFIIYVEINCFLFRLFSLASSNLFMLLRISLLWWFIFEVGLVLLFLPAFFYPIWIIFFNFISFVIQFYIFIGSLNGWSLIWIVWFISHSLNLIGWCFNSHIVCANSDSSNFTFLFWLNI